MEVPEGKDERVGVTDGVEDPLGKCGVEDTVGRAGETLPKLENVPGAPRVKEGTGGVGVALPPSPGVVVGEERGVAEVEGETDGVGVRPGVRVEEGEGVEEGESPGVRVEEEEGDGLMEEVWERDAMLGVPVPPPPTPPLVKDPELLEVYVGWEVEVVEEVGEGVEGALGDAPPDWVGGPLVGVMWGEVETVD